MLIGVLGYSVKKASSVCWHDKKDEDAFKKIMKDRDLETYLHAYTKEGITEDGDTELYKFLAIIRTIRDNKLISQMGIEQIISDLEKQELLVLLTHGLIYNKEFRKEFLMNTMEEFGIELSEDSIEQIRTIDINNGLWQKKLCKIFLMDIQIREKSDEQNDIKL